MIVDKNSFESEVINCTKPVLVDFFAVWCGPCKMMSPILDEIETEMSNAVKICKIDVDENPDIANTYSIVTLPTLILFKNGEVLAKSFGAMNKARTVNFIKHNI